MLPLITYLAGYCIFKYLQKVKCESCHNNLTVDKSIELDGQYKYITLARGGLLCPQPDVANVVAYTYVVVEKLVSAAHEAEFLKVPNQREVVLNLTYQIVLNSEVLSFDQCENGHSVEIVVKHVFRASTNTLLKNYCGQMNDFKKQSKAEKRKLQTFNKSTIPVKK